MEFDEQWYFDKFDILDGLTNDEKSKVVSMSCLTETDKGTRLYSYGDSADRLYFLKKGKVKISKYSEAGKEMIVSILEAGEIFGESSIFNETGSKHTEVAEVIEDILTCSLSIPDVKKLLANNVKFNESIINLIGIRYEKMQSRLEALFFKSTPERVKGFIKEIADEKGKLLANNTEIEVKINLTHEDIAKLTATSRQTVTSILNDLEQSGIISYDRSRILVRDYKRLA
jgi:CRP/FNR family transcriptional regulator